ncbi:hypothetical protein ERO13_A06G202200v2 [Gossypium hirsutum]|uniref:Uncharacterized protein n=4 Tax=Gossypium TaxID=3633 RepID=A0A5D2YZD9_GOSMU|nr:hypothetical protein ERO13_A06G202200v2 [Gossypium hirsutum]TYH14860.1 hypothetical protein ES288_A06G254900v1 [Gossypium darwinii]TYI24637.1 hypothetical protein ES332_A06G249100v1 [Gossypium tomentosum]TYJ31887.1 hypothetical protein E1A91_A06G231600v1 [Gossypium mustelinum]
MPNCFWEKMGSHCKRHYDITMSKRTRKPLNLQEANRQSQNHSSEWDIIPLKSIAHILDQSSPGKGEHEGGDRKSLKQLIKGDENANSKEMMGRSAKSSTSLTLGHHFTEEEKQLQLVTKHQHDNGLKLKEIMSRYAKVLRHLVKVKREPPAGSRKNPLLRLKM